MNRIILSILCIFGTLAPVQHVTTFAELKAAAESSLDPTKVNLLVCDIGETIVTSGNPLFTRFTTGKLYEAGQAPENLWTRIIKDSDDFQKLTPEQQTQFIKDEQITQSFWFFVFSYTAYNTEVQPVHPDFIAWLESFKKQTNNKIGLISTLHPALSNARAVMLKKVNLSTDNVPIIQSDDKKTAIDTLLKELSLNPAEINIIAIDDHTDKLDAIAAGFNHAILLHYTEGLVETEDAFTARYKTDIHNQADILDQLIKFWQEKVIEALKFVLKEQIDLNIKDLKMSITTTQPDQA